MERVIKAFELTHEGDRREGSGEKPALDLDHSLPVLVTMLANKIAATGSSTFRKRHGLGATEWKTLATLATLSAGSAAAVAELLAIDRAAVSRALKRLVELRLVRVSKASGRGNGQSVRLTAAGEKLHVEGLITAWQREQTLVSGLSLSERRTAVSLMRRMLSNIPAVTQLAGAPPPAELAEEGLEHISHRSDAARV